MNNYQVGGGSTVLAAIAILVIINIGLYLTNAVKLADCDFEVPYRCEVLHGIGLVPPLYLVTAWVDSDE